MISAAVVLMALQAAAPAQAPTPEEIVVTANRHSRVQYGMSVNRLTGATKCRISRSSGDPVVDRQVCEIPRSCARTSPKKRNAIEGCIEARKQQFVVSYVPRKD
jgi:hypothetical protein